jgi:hypothetical protein
LFSSYNIEQRKKFILKRFVSKPNVFPKPGLLTKAHKGLFDVHQAFPEMQVYWFFTTAP